MATITPQKKAKLTSIEKKQIKDAERIAIKLKKIHKETEVLLQQLARNPFIIKKGVSTKCDANTFKNGSGMIEFSLNVSVSIPEELIK